MKKRILKDAKSSLGDNIETYRIPVHETLEIAVRCREKFEVEFLMGQN